MKTLLWLAQGLVMLGGGGCATTRTISIAPAGLATVVSDQGVPCLQSKHANAVTVWLLTPKYQRAAREYDPPAFRVLVHNGGDREFAFSADSIAASSGTSSVRVLTPDDLRRALIRREEEQLHDIDVKAAKELAGQAALHGYAEAHTAHMDFGVNGPMRSPSPDGVGSPDLAQTRVEEAARAARAAIRDRTNQLLSDVPTMVVPTTVGPGLAAGGIVKLEPSQIHRGRPLRLVVTAGGETHEFLFDVGS
ncbi:MAG TPA: hypothetical protein VLW52_16180 [Opitutaceae bacterium]|nr:hypothetical protein [Opitutaceae bacterium]